MTSFGMWFAMKHRVKPTKPPLEKEKKDIYNYHIDERVLIIELG